MAKKATQNFADTFAAQRDYTPRELMEMSSHDLLYDVVPMSEDDTFMVLRAARTRSTLNILLSGKMLGQAIEPYINHPDKTLKQFYDRVKAETGMAPPKVRALIRIFKHLAYMGEENLSRMTQGAMEAVVKPPACLTRAEQATYVPPLWLRRWVLAQLSAGKNLDYSTVYWKIWNRNNPGKKGVKKVSQKSSTMVLQGKDGSRIEYRGPKAGMNTAQMVADLKARVSKL